jgi:hypothetical protein
VEVTWTNSASSLLGIGRCCGVSPACSIRPREEVISAVLETIATGPALEYVLWVFSMSIEDVFENALPDIR